MVPRQPLPCHCAPATLDQRSNGRKQRVTEDGQKHTGRTQPVLILWDVLHGHLAAGVGSMCSKDSCLSVPQCKTDVVFCAHDTGSLVQWSCEPPWWSFNPGLWHGTEGVYGADCERLLSPAYCRTKTFLTAPGMGLLLRPKPEKCRHSQPAHIHVAGTLGWSQRCYNVCKQSRQSHPPTTTAWHCTAAKLLINLWHLVDSLKQLVLVYFPQISHSKWKIIWMMMISLDDG